ncbi:tetratricopeptide repeat protein [bacterium]|nr:tetratricopeptide repeat protein [bacterium]
MSRLRGTPIRRAAQDLLLCLAPFTGVIDVVLLENYTNQLKAEAALSHLPFDQWQAVLQEAANWGLLSQDPQSSRFLRLQPTLPYFLRSRLTATPESPSTPPTVPPPSAGEVRRGFSAAIHAAFRRHYDSIGGALGQLITSRDPQERQLGLNLIHIEYENLLTTIHLGLAAKVAISNPYHCVDRYLELTQAHHKGIELGLSLLKTLETIPAAELSNALRFDLLRISGDVGRRQRTVQAYADSAATYLRTLTFIDGFSEETEKQKGLWKATIYHELGIVAQEQRQWGEAEGYYRQALDLKIEFNDRYSQASTYHQLGIVAQAQRQWAQARDYLMQDLTISAEFNDVHGLGITLRNLAGLWQAGEDADLPAAVAAVMGVPAAAVIAQFEKTVQDDAA